MSKSTNASKQQHVAQAVTANREDKLTASALPWVYDEYVDGMTIKAVLRSSSSPTSTPTIMVGPVTIVSTLDKDTMLMLSILSTTSTVTREHRRFVIEQFDLKTRSKNTEIQLACKVLFDRLTE